LEAQVPTHFRLADEFDAREGLDLTREATMEAAPPDAVAMVASLLGEGRFSSLLGEMEDARTRLAPIMALDPAGRRDALLRAAGIET
ncbi:hypothetical protein, partial [Enterococcus faecium]|uniref:hypothetical protein n=1 Tax=Enterococcus faecium TaxID=1352 RepID=UPI003F43925F